MSFIDKILGNTAQSQLKKLQPMVDKINALEGEIHALSDEALRGKTAAFKARLARGKVWIPCFQKPTRWRGRRRCAPLPAAL